MLSSINSINTPYTTGAIAPVVYTGDTNSSNNTLQTTGSISAHKKEEKIGLLRAWLQNSLAFTSVIFTVLGGFTGYKMAKKARLSPKLMVAGELGGSLIGHLIGISFSSFEKYAHHHIQDYTDNNISNPILKGIGDFINKSLMAIITAIALMTKTGLSIWNLQDSPKEKVHKATEQINKYAGSFFKTIFTWWNKILGNKINITGIEKHDSIFATVESLQKNAENYIKNIHRNNNLNFFQKYTLLGTGHFLKFQAGLKNYQTWKTEGKFNKKVLLHDVPRKALGEVLWLMGLQYALAGIRGIINKLHALDTVEEKIVGALPINVEEERKEKLVKYLQKVNKNEEMPARKIIDLQALGLTNANTSTDDNN